MQSNNMALLLILNVIYQLTQNVINMEILILSHTMKYKEKWQKDDINNRIKIKFFMLHLYLIYLLFKNK